MLRKYLRVSVRGSGCTGFCWDSCTFWCALCWCFSLFSIPQTSQWLYSTFLPWPVCHSGGSQSPSTVLCFRFLWPLGASFLPRGFVFMPPVLTSLAVGRIRWQSWLVPWSVELWAGRGCALLPHSWSRCLSWEALTTARPRSYTVACLVLCICVLRNPERNFAFSTELTCHELLAGSSWALLPVHFDSNKITLQQRTQHTGHALGAGQPKPEGAEVGL